MFLLKSAYLLFYRNKLFVVELWSILWGSVKNNYGEGPILPIKLFSKILFLSFLINNLVDVNLVSRGTFFVLLLKLIKEFIHICFENLIPFGPIALTFLLIIHLSFFARFTIKYWVLVLALILQIVFLRLLIHTNTSILLEEIARSRPRIVYWCPNKSTQNALLYRVEPLLETFLKGIFLSEIVLRILLSSTNTHPSINS